jgi:hypothetical protein
MTGPNPPNPPGSPALGALGPSGPDWQPVRRPYLTQRRPSLDKVLPHRALSALTALASLPAGSVLLAVLFGLIALPAVVLGVPAYDMDAVRPYWTHDSAAIPALSAPVLQAAIGAVLASVLVAAPIGAVVARRHLVLGALATILTAWIVGIVALPVLPSLLGFRYGAVNFCLDSCSPQIVGIGGGIDAFIIDGKPNAFALIFSPFYGFLPLVALVIGVSFWAPIVRRSARQTGSNR